MTRKHYHDPNQPHLATVSSLTHDGRGVARAAGKVVFIDDALPGEEVRYHLQKIRRSYDAGTIVEIVTPSLDRVSPKCRYFGVCGGCALQHLGLAAQVKFKQQHLINELEKIGRVVPESILRPITASAWRYRRKARLGVRFVPKKGGVLVGFRERRKSYITALDDCEILHPSIAILLPALHQLISDLSCRQRLPQVEVAAGENATALVFRHLVPLTGRDRGLLAEFARAHNVQVFSQSAGLDSLNCLWPLSPDRLSYRLDAFGIELEFAPTDFVQVNADINARLVAGVLDLLQPESHHRVLDAFCGVGNFSLPLARRAAEVIGLEGDSALVERAKHNAAHNGCDNARFAAVDLFNGTLEHPALNERYERVLLDPPRSGAMEIVKRASHFAASRIVYVSCNPATLARDSAVLVHRHGFKLSAAGVVNMFPHTSHVESIAVYDAC